MNIQSLKKRLSARLLKLIAISAPLLWGGVGGGLLCSCGDLFEFEGNTLVGSKVTLSRHTLYLMAGETYELTASFAPDTVRNQAIYWLSNDVSVARFDNGILEAVSEGETTVTGISIEQQTSDTCHVVVGYEWGEVDPYGYPFDMMIYADITVDGQPLNDRQTVGAFVGTELRGIGVQRESNGVKYTELRVYSRLNPHGPFTDLNPQDPLYPYDNEYEPERVVIRVYDRDSHTMYESLEPIVFDGETHGYLSNLYKLSL